MIIDIHIINFKSWADFSTRFFPGVTLVDGNSGTGKSSILCAIFHALFGTERGTATTGKKTSEVKLVLDEKYTIVRTSRPRSLVFIKHVSGPRGDEGDQVWSGDEAQSMIDDLFCERTLFTNVMYHRQKGVSAFTSMTPQSRMIFLNEMFNDTFDVEGVIKTINTKTLDTDRRIVKTQTLAEIHPVPEKVPKTKTNKKEPLESRIQCLRKAVASIPDLVKKREEYKTASTVGNTYDDLAAEIYALSKKNDEMNHQLDLVELRESVAIRKKKFKTLKKKLKELAWDSKSDMENAAVYFRYLSDIKKCNYDKDELDSLERPMIEQMCEYCSIMTTTCPHEHGPIALERLKDSGMTNDEYLTYKACSKHQAASIIGSTVCEHCSETTRVQCEIVESEDFDRLDALSKKSFRRQCPWDNMTLVTCCHPLSALSTSEIPLLTQEQYKRLEILRKTRDRLDVSFTKVDLANKTERDDAFIRLKSLRIEDYVSASEMEQCLITPVYNPKEHIEIQERMNDLRVALKESKEASRKKRHMERDIKLVHTVLEECGLKELEDIVPELESLENEVRDIDTYHAYQKAVQIQVALVNETEEKAVYSHANTLVKRTGATCIQQLLDTINLSLKQYVDCFFTEDKMTASLSVFTESGKPCVHLDIGFTDRVAEFKTLSGGEQDRLALAMTLAFASVIDCPLLMLDEVVSSLDSDTIENIVYTIKNNFSDRVVLFVAHQVVQGTYDRVITIA